MSTHHRDHQQAQASSTHGEHRRQRDPARPAAAGRRRAGDEQLRGLVAAAALAAIQEHAPGLAATLRELHRLGETPAAVEQRLLAAGRGSRSLRELVATAYTHLHRFPIHPR